MRVSKSAQASSREWGHKRLLFVELQRKAFEMHTTGNAGGSHNLRMFDNNSHTGNNLNECLNLWERTFCYRINGPGVNISRVIIPGRFRFLDTKWANFISSLRNNVAGNLKEMFQNIVSIGTDEYRRGSKTTGSV